MRCLVPISLGLVLCLFPGCSMFLEGASLDEKRESILPYDEHLVEGQSIRRFVRERIGLLIQGEFESTGSFSILSNGAAVAVSPDGYFLTADHCVDSVEAPLYLAHAPLVAFDAKSLHVARVVWRSADCDLALLHADLEPRGHVEAWARAPLGNEPVLSGGFPGRAYVILAAGRVLHVGHCVSADAVVEVHHNAPVRRGDSGGPVFTAAGEFVGINVEGIYHWPFLNLTAKALLPDPEFVQELIERDRASRE